MRKKDNNYNQWLIIKQQIKYEIYTNKSINL